MPWGQLDYSKKRSEKERPIQKASWPRVGALQPHRIRDLYTAHTCVLSLRLEKATPLYLVLCTTYAALADTSVEVETQIYVCRSQSVVGYSAQKQNYLRFYYVVHKSYNFSAPRYLLYRMNHKLQNLQKTFPTIVRSVAIFALLCSSPLFNEPNLGFFLRVLIACAA